LPFVNADERLAVRLGAESPQGIQIVLIAYQEFSWLVDDS